MAELGQLEKYVMISKPNCYGGYGPSTMDILTSSQEGLGYWLDQFWEKQDNAEDMSLGCLFRAREAAIQDLYLHMKYAGCLHLWRPLIQVIATCWIEEVGPEGSSVEWSERELQYILEFK